MLYTIAGYVTETHQATVGHIEAETGDEAVRAYVNRYPHVAVVAAFKGSMEAADQEEYVFTADSLDAEAVS